MHPSRLIRTLQAIEHTLTIGALALGAIALWAGVCLALGAAFALAI